MDRVPERMAGWWGGLDAPARRRARALAWIVGAYLVHYVVYCIPQPFFIEDAGISFAFAENIARGEGPVPFPGAEPVEGFSNALWTYLLAALYALGVPTWTAAKLLGAVFGAATLPLVAGIARRARPGGREDAALLAPAMLAASPQFVVWNASGLENSLFVFLLALGTWRLLAELEEPDRARRPWSALAWFAVTATRPEGAMYAALAALLVAVDLARAAGPALLLPWRLRPDARARLRRAAAWGALLALTWAAYNAWRTWTFAWPFPNTYYAKLETRTRTNWFNLKGGGWKYTFRYLHDHGLLWALPLLGVATVGVRPRRRAVLLALLVALVAGALAWDGRQQLVDLPDAIERAVRRWSHVQVWTMLAAAVVAGLAALGRRGWRARALLWALACSGVFFVVYARGDWMKAHRWFNIVGLSLLPLVAIGLGDLLDVALPWGGPALRRLAGPLVPDARAAAVVLLALAWVGNEARLSYAFAMKPETAVRDVHRRVVYMQWVQRRLDVDDVLLMDVDMGAHMYFSGWRILDYAGLIDVPVAHHRDFNRKFLRQYVFEEQRPEFAHVHGAWARSSRIPSFEEWKRDYLEIPGYPIGGRKLHVGNHVRKDLFVRRADEPEPGGDAVAFEGGVWLTRLAVPSPEVPPGGPVFLDTEWAAAGREAGFRILFVLDDGAGRRAVVEAPPGYDWYRPEDWRARERVAGRYALELPAALGPGAYRLGVVLVDEETGEVLAVRDPSAPAPGGGGGSDDARAPGPRGDAGEDPVTEAAPVYLPGEWWSGLVVRVVPGDEARARAEEDLAAALDAARSGDCDAAWPRFKDATRHVLADREWKRRHAPEVRTAIASCLVGRARAATERADAVEALAAALRWDHRHREALRLARPLADELDAEGRRLYETGNWAGAYRAFRDALRLDRMRAWTRRRAEDARDRLLGITRPEHRERG